MAITNLDHVKTLHLAKGEVVGFARPESSEVTYIATTNELNIEEVIDMKPRNWIPQQKWSSHSQEIPKPQAKNSNFLRTFAKFETAYRRTRNRGGEYSNKTDHSDVSRVNTQIRRTFSKFAVARCRKGNKLSTEYQL